MLAKVGNKDSHSIIQALIEQSRKLPKDLYRSLTWDRGSEIAGNKTFTLATDIDVYLCEPHSPWQRGSNVTTPLGPPA
jgi:IS30 family transposase